MRELISIIDITVRDVPVTVVKILVPDVHSSEVIQTIGSQLYSLVEEHGRKNLLLNLGRVQSLLTEFLGKLLGLQKRTSLAKGKLALCGLTPIVQEALDVCGLTGYFAIYRDEQEALNKHF